MYNKYTYSRQSFLLKV